MTRATRCLLWLFVFSMPWEAVTLPWVGRIAVLLGIAVIATGALTTAANGRLRRPGLVLSLAVTFTLSSLLSLLWTISYDLTVQRVWTYAQLLGVVWVVREFARTSEERRSLLFAFCAGAFVPLAGIIQNSLAEAQIGRGDLRYSASGYNANDLGLTFVLGMPMAWHLLMNRRGPARIVALTYLCVAPVGVLLTGSRGAFLAGFIALSIVPLTLPRLPRRTLVLIPAALIVVSALTAAMVPSYIWDRIFTIRQEISGEGTLTGRIAIWSAGWEAFLERPGLGVGAGAFATAVAPMLPTERMRASHNVLLAVLVEQGVFGLSVFAALLGACAWVILAFPPPDRKLWAVVMLTWFVGVMSVGWQYRKLTWFLFGLLAAQEGLEAARRRTPAARGRVSPENNEITGNWRRPSAAQQ